MHDTLMGRVCSKTQVVSLGHQVCLSLPTLPYIFYTQIEDSLFLRSKWLLRGVSFHGTNKAATLLFAVMKKKISFLFNHFYYTEEAGGKQFLRIRKLHFTSTSMASIKGKRRVRLNAVVLFY
jgi:hypothetical protein